MSSLTILYLKLIVIFKQTNLKIDLFLKDIAVDGYKADVIAQNVVRITFINLYLFIKECQCASEALNIFFSDSKHFQAFTEWLYASKHCCYYAKPIWIQVD